MRFRWIGDGDEDLREVLEDAGVEVTGWLDRAELRRTLLASDLMLHTATWEGFPVSVVDAAALDLPVVARAIAPLTAEGVLTVEDDDALADAVLAALDDEPFRHDLIRRSQEITHRMSRSEQSRRISALYADLLGGTA